MVDKLVKNASPNWGGKRDGAGRKPSGKKQVNFYLTEDEKIKLRKCLMELRANKAKEDNNG